MRKSTIIVILIVYLVSIVAIGFFGMAVKVYDETKYVKSIEITVEAEHNESYLYKELGKDSQTNDNSYRVIVDFSNFGAMDQNGEKVYLLSIIPYVTYDTGDVAGETEGIVYSTNTPNFEQKNFIELKQNGQLVCKRANISFAIFVKPEQSGAKGTGAIVYIDVV